MLLISIASLVACQTESKKIYKGGEAYELCVLDPAENMCWAKKSERTGVSLLTIQNDMEKCFAGEKEFCWFGINKKDLDRLFKSLNH
jgi:hypothetical protein